MPAVLGILLAAALPVPASANVMWCVYDPPIQVVTPGGHNLTVNNAIYIPVNERHLASHFSASASAVSNGHGGTLITVNVYVPSAILTAHVVARENRYQVSSEGGGTGGEVVSLGLDVPTS